jgi:hypothetical protein
MPSSLLTSTRGRLPLVDAIRIKLRLAVAAASAAGVGLGAVAVLDKDLACTTRLLPIMLVGKVTHESLYLSS